MSTGSTTLIICALVITVYLVFTAFVVRVLASEVPHAIGRTLIAVTALVAGLPSILLALHGVLTG